MSIVEAGPAQARGRPTWVPAFFIDVEPVSNAEYSRFLIAADHRPPSAWSNGNYDIADDPPALHADPITGLMCGDVGVYASWSGKSLPTPVQLDQAARDGVIILRGVSGAIMPASKRLSTVNPAPRNESANAASASRPTAVLSTTNISSFDVVES
jgi:hypothetical protein